MEVCPWPPWCMVLAKNQYKYVRLECQYILNPPYGVLSCKGKLIFIYVTGRDGGKHTVCLCSCSFLMSKKGKELQLQLLLALFQMRLVSWMDGISNEAAKCTIKVSCTLLCTCPRWLYHPQATFFLESKLWRKRYQVFFIFSVQNHA